MLPSLSSHFSFQSLRDNIAHQNKAANDLEWKKEKLDRKNSENNFFPWPCIGLFQALSVLETAKVRLGLSGVLLTIGWGESYQLGRVSIMLFLFLLLVPALPIITQAPPACHRMREE